MSNYRYIVVKRTEYKSFKEAHAQMKKEYEATKGYYYGELNDYDAWLQDADKIMPDISWEIVREEGE